MMAIDKKCSHALAVIALDSSAKVWWVGLQAVGRLWATRVRSATSVGKVQGVTDSEVA